MRRGCLNPLRDHKMKFKKISCTEAKKLFLENKPFYACPHKLRPSSSFNIAALVFGLEYKQRAERYKVHGDIWKGTIEKTAWNLFAKAWKHYNGSYEGGYYPAYYVEDN